VASVLCVRLDQTVGFTQCDTQAWVTPFDQADKNEQVSYLRFARVAFSFPVAAPFVLQDLMRLTASLLQFFLIPFLFAAQQMLVRSQMSAYVASQLLSTLLEMAKRSQSDKDLLLLNQIVCVLSSDSLDPIRTLVAQKNVSLERKDTWSDVEALRMARASEEPRSKQATLAALAPVKARLMRQLAASEAEGSPQL